MTTTRPSARPPLPPEDLDLVLQLTSDLWPRFRGCRMLVTGGTGFIGSWLLEVIMRANRVLDARIDIAVVSRDPAAARAFAPALFSAGGPTLLQGDVVSLHEIPDRFDLCIHAAADVGQPTQAAARRRLFDTLTVGTARVLDACAAAGASHVLVTSSGAVYGPQPPQLSHVDEGFVGAPDPLDPSAAYANGKRTAEWLASEHAARTGMQVGIARIFALVGPNMPFDGGFAAGNFVRDALARRPIHIQGDGRPLRSYLYIADACAWLLRILAQGRPGEAYNVGSEEVVSIAELADAVIAAAGIKLPVHIQAPRDDSTMPPRYVPSTAKARADLGVAQVTSLAQALSKTIHWSRSATT